MSPKHVTKASFEKTRGQPPLQVHVTIAYGYGCVFGMLMSAARAIEAWAAAETAFLRSPAKAKNMQTMLEQHIDLTCQRLEELLLLSGGVPRLQRLLEGSRGLRFVLGQGCHHNATKMMPALLLLAGECSHDLVDYHAEAARKLQRDLMLRRLPVSVRTYFEEARDSLLLQHDELGAFAACRGLERGCKDVASAHAVNLVIGSAAPRPLAACDLHDVLEALARCQWADGSPVIDKANRALVQFVRQMRNTAGHAASSSVAQWRETAVLAAAATCRLLERSAEANQTITPTTVTKNW